MSRKAWLLFSGRHKENSGVEENTLDKEDWSRACGPLYTPLLLLCQTGLVQSLWAPVHTLTSPLPDRTGPEPVGPCTHPYFSSTRQDWSRACGPLYTPYFSSARQDWSRACGPLYTPLLLLYQTGLVQSLWAPVHTLTSPLPDRTGPEPVGPCTHAYFSSARQDWSRACGPLYTPLLLLCQTGLVQSLWAPVHTLTSPLPDRTGPEPVGPCTHAYFSSARQDWSRACGPLYTPLLLLYQTGLVQSLWAPVHTLTSPLPDRTGPEPVGPCTHAYFSSARQDWSRACGPLYTPLLLLCQTGLVQSLWAPVHTLTSPLPDRTGPEPVGPCTHPYFSSARHPFSKPPLASQFYFTTPRVCSA
ncbi:hypothetical protein STEG23_026252 [Scotinomys teguina]